MQTKTVLLTKKKKSLRWFQCIRNESEKYIKSVPIVVISVAPPGFVACPYQARRGTVRVQKQCNAIPSRVSLHQPLATAPPP